MFLLHVFGAEKDKKNCDTCQLCRTQSATIAQMQRHEKRLSCSIKMIRNECNEKNIKERNLHFANMSTVLFIHP